MTTRSVEDTLREEYSDLLPDIRRTVGELDARARYAMMPIALGLKLRHEQIVVRSRVKDCESAIGALRRRQEGKLFDQAARLSTRRSTNPIANSWALAANL